MLNYSLTFFEVDKNGRSRELLTEPVTVESDVEAILHARDRAQAAARELNEPRPLACTLVDENGDVVWRTPTRTGLTGLPPTVADLQTMGVSGALLTCWECNHAARLSFDDLGVQGDIAFSVIARLDLKCQQCGAQDPLAVPE